MPDLLRTSLSPVRAFAHNAPPCPRTALAHGVAAALCLLPLLASAQEPPLPPDGPPLVLRASSQLQETIPDAVRAQMPTFVSGDHIEGQPDVRAVLEGNAELRRADTVIRAQRMEYTVPEDFLQAQGQVRINRAGNVYEGTLLELRVNAFEGFFNDARYQFLRNAAHGQAERVDFLDRDRAIVRQATYTTCERTD